MKAIAGRLAWTWYAGGAGLWLLLGLCGFRWPSLDAAVGMLGLVWLASVIVGMVGLLLWSVWTARW